MSMFFENCNVSNPQIYRHPLTCEFSRPSILDRDEVIKRARERYMESINVGTQIDTSEESRKEIANEHSGGRVRHYRPPSDSILGASYHDEKELGEGGKEFTSRGEQFDKEKYRELLKDPKVVAIGECGLDYFRMEPESIEKQKKAFIAQIEPANEFEKPLSASHLATTRRKN